MAGCSTFTYGSSLDCLETVDAYHGNGCCLAFNHLVKDQVDNGNDDKVKQKCLFYKLFSVYLKENYSKGIIRPVPVLLGDGQSLDLYKLLSSVKERGGYALVSKKGLWSSVAKELGLNLKVLTSVKLVYDKYLNEFEGWLRKTCGRKNFSNGDHGFDWGIETLPPELEKEFRGLLSPNLKWKDDQPVQLESNKLRNYIGVVIHKSETNILDTKNQYTILEDAHGDDDEKCCTCVKDDLATFDTEIARKEFKSHKRKREALSRMLNWMRDIAKHPFDCSIKPIPEPDKWQEHKGKDFWAQILRAREALLLRQCIEPNSRPSCLQKLKMHPAMYEDHATLTFQSTVKLRCSERSLTSVKSRLCSCCNSCSASGNKSRSANTKAENGPLEQTTTTVDLLTANLMVNPSGDDDIQKHVSVGPLFQVEVPEWTGVVSDSDSKWLGIPVWPLRYSEPKPVTETDRIGRGRQEKCSCQFQGFVECIRFHIAEKRMKLKLELGSVFYIWGFDSMGEEVSLQWTTEEEKKFKDMMRSNLPSQSRCFWNNSFKYFPKKTRRNLVSYYFNVFLIQRRSYQNRVTPVNVDSDDDELEFGSLSDGFGMEAVKGPGINLECSQNKQDTDLEQTKLKSGNSISGFEL